MFGKYLNFLALSLFILLSVACSGKGEPEAVENAYQVVQKAELGVGDPVPAPVGPVVLTLSGNISNANVGDVLQFDMATLEMIGVVSYRVDDKQAEGREVEFEGVLMNHLLAVAGVADEATTLYTVALNDYAVEIPVEDVETYPVLLATAVDGERMDIERYGPVRLVYPYHHFDLDETIYDPRWIWQLTTIDVRK